MAVSTVSGMDGSRGDGFSESRVVGGEGGLAGLGSGLVGLDRRTESEFVGLVFNTAVSAVDLSEIVRSHNTMVASLLLTSVHVSVTILDVVFELVVSVVILVSVCARLSSVTTEVTGESHRKHAGSSQQKLKRRSVSTWQKFDIRSQS